MNTFEYNANRQISQLHDRIKKLEEEILTVRIAEAEQRRCAEEALAKLSRYEQSVRVEGTVPKQVTEYKLYNEIWNKFAGQRVTVIVLPMEDV